MKRLAAILALGASLALSAPAQSLQTAYFLDNYVYSYQLNPAFCPDNTKGFFGLLVDNVSLGINSNVGLNSFVYPVTVDGKDKLVTGFNSAVPVETFLNAIGKSLIMNGEINENIFSFGFSRGKSFITVETNLRADIGMDFPGEFVSLLKSGTNQKGVYSIGDINADAAVYAELAGSYSRQVTDRLRLGGRLKILAGAGEGSMNISGLKAEISDDIAIDGNSFVCAHVLNTDISEDEYGDPVLDDFSFSAGSLSYGAALDLGAEYKILDNMTVSASVNDLGGIVWKNRQEARTSVEMLETDDLFNFKSSGMNDFLGLGARVNAGIRYDVLSKLSVGFLGTVRTGRFGWAEARAGATYTPAKVFSIAASAGVNSFGTCFGAAMSLKIPIVNLYLGFDAFPTRFTPQYVPIGKLHTRINLGLAIAF